MRLRSTAAAYALSALALLLAAGPAAAKCDLDTAIYEDDFEFLDGTWGDADRQFYVEDGSAIIEEWAGRINFATQNKGANVCVDMTIVDAAEIGYSPIGLVFWWEDWENYYVVYYWADGWLELRRVIKGQEKVLVTREHNNLREGVGATNQIELDLGRRDATLYINGKRITRFKGKQPKDGGIVGFDALSPPDNPATFAYDNLIVSEN